MSAIHCFVSGRVQGVWFRVSTQRQAQGLGLTGYARNLADGRVEVLACGDEAGVNDLHQWLHQGPPGAEVVAVECGPWNGDEPEGFTTG